MRLLARLSTLVLTAAVSTVGLAALSPSAQAAESTLAGSSLRYYGAQLHSLWYDNTAADVERQLDLLAGTAANAARVDVAWSSLQTSGPTSYNSTYTAKIDALVAGATRRGISLVLTLNETPCWASSAPATLVQDCAGAYWERNVTRYPPRDAGDFARAAAWIAERYGSRVAALELWNEPNYVGADGYSPLISTNRPAAYAALVKAAYPAVKAVAPALSVLAGAMSFSDDTFLKALYAEGIRGNYDGISVHPYNEWRAPGAPHDITYYKYDYVQGMQAVHAAMIAGGDNTPVWITEMGWTNCTVGGDRWCVTADQQASYIASAAKMAATWSWVKAFIAYNLRDKGTDVSYTEDNFGLVRRDYTPKPALAALGTAFRSIAAAAAAPSLTTAASVSAPTTTVSAPTVATRTLPKKAVKWSKARAVKAAARR